MQPDFKAKPLTGLLVASVIVFLWSSSLAFFLAIDLVQLAPIWILPAILGRTFIQTGLFIAAHDAIHGSVIPNVGETSPLENRRLNHWIGQLMLTLYALLPYQKLAFNHWQHHRQPGQAGDPDLHDGIHCNIAAWYVKFMKGYLDGRQRVLLFFGMSLIFFTLYLGLHVPIANLLLFWVMPIVLSSMQLFLFGTYLPHRFAQSEVPSTLSVVSATSGNTENLHHATSSNYPPIWSFFTCYHFGYHWEHHEYPSLPWYRLPSAR